MAAAMKASWEEALFSFGNPLMEPEIQDNPKIW